MDDELPGGVWRVDERVKEDMRLDRIRQALDAEAWEVAAIEAEELLDESPTHPEGLFLLGEALLQLGDFELGRLTYQQRVDLDGGDLGSLIGLGITAFQTCDLQVAIETAREVIRLQPDIAEAHYYLGLALEFTRGRAHEAMSALTAAMQLDPERFPLPMQLDEEGWRRVIYGALSILHPRLQRFYVGMDFRLEDLPKLAELRAHEPPLPPTIGVMYEGEPPDPDDADGRRPVAMRLFTRNLGRSPTEEIMIDQLAVGLHDEAVHWLGLNPHELDDA